MRITDDGSGTYLTGFAHGPRDRTSRECTVISITVCHKRGLLPPSRSASSVNSIGKNGGPTLSGHAYPSAQRKEAAHQRAG